VSTKELDHRHIKQPLLGATYFWILLSFCLLHPPTSAARIRSNDSGWRKLSTMQRIVLCVFCGSSDCSYSINALQGISKL
jgi:hypothetical protein